MRQSPIRSLHHAGTEYRAIGDSEIAWSCRGLDDEYRSLRGRAGLIDCFACGLVAVTGDDDDNETFLNSVLARDVTYLAPERSLVSLVLDTDGNAVDIVTVYRLDDGFIIESSPGNVTRTESHLRSCLAELDHPGVRLTSLCDDRTVIAIEGPYAWAEVGKILNQELTALPYESIVGTEWNDRSILFARSGVTGEYGYKVIADIEAAAELWEQLGATVPQVGLETVELAMLEVRQPVFHLECIGTDVLTAGLNWLIDMSKESFFGREAIAQLAANGVPQVALGFALASDDAVDVGSAIEIDGHVIGRVAVVATSPGLGQRLGLAHVDAEMAASGLELQCSTSDGTLVVARTLSSPYVLPASWSVPLF